MGRGKGKGYTLRADGVVRKGGRKGKVYLGAGETRKNKEIQRK